MLLQLTVDMGAEPPATRSNIAALLGETMAEIFMRGHKADLHTIDLDLLDDAPESETAEHAHARGVIEGYGKGFVEGHQIGRRAQADKIEHALQGAQTSFNVAWDSTTPDTTFPDSIPLPEGYNPGTPRHLLGLHATIGQAEQPNGDRPAVEPGAPVSAYDAMAPSTAHDDYGFPQYPDDRARHTDTEGALWFYSGVPKRQWERCSYPREWGAASSGDFRPIHFTG